MANKKKSFYFEDYVESEFTDNSKFKNIKVSLNRVTFLSFIFFSLILICSIKIIYLALSPEKSFYTDNIKDDFIKNRRDIIDRNGAVLATNVDLYDVGVRSKLLKKKEKKNLIIKLSLLLPEIDLKKIKHKLDNDEFKNMSINMLNNIKPHMNNYGSGYANYASLMLKQINPYYEIAIVGKEAQAKKLEINKYYYPNKLFIGSLEASNLDLLEGKFVEGSTMIYVCENKVCQLPTSNIKEAIKQIK